MILLTILAIICVSLLLSSIFILAIGGTAFGIVFADLFVCALFIGWVMKKLISKKKKGS